MSSVGEELLNHIERVSAKRERWRQYAKEAGPQAFFGPGIAMMTAAIDAGKAAIASNNVLASLRAYEELKGFDDND